MQAWFSFAEASENEVILQMIFFENAGVVELVDTLDLGSSAERCESSSLSACTNEEPLF